MTFDPSEPEPAATRGLRSNVCVRDVSWHSQVFYGYFRSIYLS